MRTSLPRQNSNVSNALFDKYWYIRLKQLWDIRNSWPCYGHYLLYLVLPVYAIHSTHSFSPFSLIIYYVENTYQNGKYILKKNQSIAKSFEVISLVTARYSSCNNIVIRFLARFLSDPKVYRFLRNSSIISFQTAFPIFQSLKISLPSDKWSLLLNQFRTFWTLL